MKYIKIIGLIITIHFSTLCQAQDKGNYNNKKNQFQISVGVQYIKTRDLQFSPNLYHSTRPCIELGYSRILKSGIFIASLDLASGTLLPHNGKFNKVYIRETDFFGNEMIEETELINSQILLNFSIGYLHKINAYSTERLNLYLGGNVKEHLTFAPGLISLGSINYLSLNLASRADFRLSNGKTLTGAFEFPVLSIVTRLPYHNAPAIPDKSDFATFFTSYNDLETVNRFQNIKLTVSYPVWVGRKIALNATYKFQWMHYSLPEHTTETGSQILLSFNF